MDALPQSLNLAGWLIAAFFTLKIWNEAHRALDRQKESPPPAMTYVAKLEAEKAEKSNADEHLRLHGRISEARNKAEADLKAAMIGVGEQFQALQEQIKNAPAETVALLRATKGLL